METQPQQPDKLQDPKLPVIHAGVPGNHMQQRRSDSPCPKTDASESL